MTMQERICNELNRRFIASNYEAITITMNSTNEDITIIPCCYISNPTIDDIQYFLIECKLPWCGSEKLEDVATFIMNYDNEVSENRKEKESLRKFYEAHKNDTDRDWWNYYSDWYKDVYGHRP